MLQDLLMFSRLDLLCVESWPAVEEAGPLDGVVGDVAELGHHVLVHGLVAARHVEVDVLELVAGGQELVEVLFLLFS